MGVSAPSHPYATPLHLIVYMSSATPDCDKNVTSELKNIISVARRENAAHAITGLLFYLDRKFLQIIEGPEAKLRQLMTNIERDNRHRDLHYLIDTPVEMRGFKDWSMESFHLGTGQVFDENTLKKITTSFKKNILPRSDMVHFYYKTLLAEQAV